MLKRLSRFFFYNFKESEAKWQDIWKTKPIRKTGEKFYCLSMFPYPSGNLHIGHVRVYAISDALSRYEGLNGKTVLHPMGWDAFGLPAENAAIERKVPASLWTMQNISQMKLQMEKLGFLFSWDREISTCSPEYYKWTQWLFLNLFKKGLAYQKEAYINWDPVDNTVLANEQVDEKGRSWRSGALVERKLMKQWYLKITHYAEDLLNGLNSLQWPGPVKEMQKGWIGKTVGVEISFKSNCGELKVFTTRIDTIMGVVFIGLSAEHELVNKFTGETEILKINAIKNKPETLRKIGKNYVVLSQIKAIHPIKGTELPVVVTEYVINNVGTGAIMGVPAHDSRDFLIACELNLEIIKVVENEKLINSDEFNGLGLAEASEKITEKLLGKIQVNYRMKDWLVSRQRYWGVPIPVIHCSTCGVVPDTSLPLLLPNIEEKEKWLKTICPNCKNPAMRESDTLDTFVDSSWYYLRYIDPHNSLHICDQKLAHKWTPVDVYIGGIEHAILHLLYSRFIHKVLKDENIVKSPEPFHKLFTQGLVLGSTYKVDGKYVTAEEAKVLSGVEIKFEKMSKSKKNGVDLPGIIEEWGADVLRVAVLFAAPSEKELEWNGSLLKTVKKWLKTICEIQELTEGPGPDKKLTKEITKAMQEKKFHVAIARLMEYSHRIREDLDRSSMKEFLIMLHPFAPHLTSELFLAHFQEDIREADWPRTNNI